MRESKVEAHLVKRIHRIGGKAFKVKFPGIDGAPDRLVMLPGGEITWVELKKIDGRIRPAQISLHKLFKEFQQEVFILRTIEAIDTMFPIER